jgi:flavin reductase (DIM6/NTAB) family NADH-FMN oxidoreductase RutF
VYYDATTNQHNLAHDPFKAIVSPRPIGWISSMSKSGVANLAPYSFFNAMGERPKMVIFGSAGIKDNARNIAETGEFTCNFVSDNLKEVMNLSSADCPPDVSEFDYAGIEQVAGKMVNCPRVAKAFAALECKLVQIINPLDIDGNQSNNHLFIGQVVGIHITEEAIVDGRFDVTIAKPVSRLGYFDYSTVENVYEMKRPIYEE